MAKKISLPLHKAIASRVQGEEPVNGIRLLTFPTSIKDAVFITGSLLGGALYSPKEAPMAAGLVAAMLDEGTKKHTKEEIREMLESLGAHVEFTIDTYRVRFSVHCLKKDAGKVLELLAEQLRQPRFSARDLAVVKKRIAATLEESKEETRTQAQIRLLQTLYPKNHPNYRYDPATAILLVQKTTRADIVRFHKEAYGLGNMLICVAGDVDARQLGTYLKKAFGGWKKSPLAFFPTTLRSRTLGSQEDVIPIPDKTSVDVYTGGGTGIDSKHPSYHALAMGLNILGGGGIFLSRLMKIVREKKGLTYGIRAGLAGSGNAADGYWFIWGTFAPTLLAKGKEALMLELTTLVKKGISAEELVTHKQAITGAYWVNLGSAQAMAAALLVNAEEDRPVDYLDEYPSIINKLSLQEVDDAIKKYLNLNSVVTVSAGTIEQG